MAGPTLEQIMATLTERRKDQGVILDSMRKVRDAYNGDVIVPMPELDRLEAPSVINMVNTALDQTAMRIASTIPDLGVPVLRPGIKTSEDKARTLRRANLSWWEINKLPLKMRRRARSLIGYASSPVVIRPDQKRGAPRWETRDALSTYPCPTGDPDDFTPPDCIFTFQRSYRWLTLNYPDKMGALNIGVGYGKTPDPADRFDVVEYVDADVTVLAVLGRNVNPMALSMPLSTPGAPFVELERIPNRTELCPAVVPGRITLDRPLGQFDGMIGMYQTMAKLTALEIIAVERGIFPANFLISRPGETARFLAGPFDGRSGYVNIVAGGDIKETNPNPGFATTNTIDRIERAARITGGAPSEYGGECVDEATEILTADGWRTHDKVSVGDLVLTLNHETGMSEWQPVERMNVYPAVPGRPMIEMEGPRFSALTTVNHRWAVVRHGKRIWKNSPDLTTIDQIPVAAMHADLPTEPKYSDALVEAVAWFYTEGHIRPSGGEISQSTKKPEYVERIRACLRTLFGAATVENWRPLSGCGQGGVGHDGVPRWREFAPMPNGVIKFRLSAHASRLLEQHAPRKVPTFDFLRSLTAAQLELFLNVSLFADNCGVDLFGQKDRDRSEAFAFACVLSGRGVAFRHRIKTEAREGWRAGEYETHIVRMRKRRFVKPKENAERGISSFREVTHDGMVWCPTTANQSWFARRGTGTAYFTGNSPTNVRTGKRGDAVMSAIIDFPVQEAQEVLAASLVEENRRAIATAKAYFGNERKSFYVSTGKSPGHVDYTPNKDFETDLTRVTYPHAGADANALIIGLGQRQASGMMSTRTAMEIDPMVGDPELELDRITSEGLQRSLLTSLEQQASQGAIPPHDLARIQTLVATHQKTLAEAVDIVQAEAQARQATPAPQGAPETQPGLAQPGAGAEQPAIQPPTPNEDNLSMLIRSLRSPQRALAPSEKGAA